jgi:ATP-binding cassette subfamily F protein 3
VVTRIVHLEHQKTNSYTGNYSAFENSRAERLALQQASYEKQQKRRKDVEAFVARFRYKASKAKQAQSRLKELERMDNIAPAHVDSPFYFSFPVPKKAFGALVNVSQATLGYGETAILDDVNFDLQPGTRIGLLGPNGAGKSTLINSLTGDLKLLMGTRVYGENLKVGYFAQHQLEVLDLQASPLLHIQRLSPAATDQEVRNFLGGFDFHNDKALDPIADFSGGEKARLALALIVWQKPNLLLLDEPTNHLDLEMRHALTMALQSYEGALVVISHDRHLLKNTVDEFYLVADGEVKEFDGDLGDYQRWLKDFQRQISIEPSICTAPLKDKKAHRQKAARQRQQLAPLTKQLRQLETAMEQQQRELDKVENSLSDESLYTDEKKGQLTQLLQRQADVKRKLQEVEEQWLQLQENLETLTNAQR